MNFSDKIKAIPITDYAVSYCGYTLVRKGIRYVSLEEHDSVMIDVQKNCYWRNSVFQKGAKNRAGASGSIIDFAIEFGNASDPKSAMRELAVLYNISSEKMPMQSICDEVISEYKHGLKERPKLTLPPKAADTKIVYRYLVGERKIDPSVVRYFLAKKMLYQDAVHHNCVFVSKGFACVRSTNQKRFVLDLEGCDYDECFYFRPNSEATILVVAESVIDIMSIMTQFVREHKRYTNYAYLALSGTNKLSSLFYHLEKESDIRHVMLAFDNDDAGMRAQKAALEGLKAKSYAGTVELFPAPSEKDWNDYIKATSLVQRNDPHKTS